MSKIDRYLTEASSNKLNKDISKQLKSMANELIGTSRQVKEGDFPYDIPKNIKESLNIEFTGIRMQLDSILRMIK